MEAIMLTSHFVAARRIASLGAICWAVVSCGAPLVEPPSGLLVHDVHVFDVSRGTFSEPVGILIRDGRIHSVGPPETLGEPEERVDAQGAFALPGLWDSHVHLGYLSLAGDDSLGIELARFVRSGVLYVRDVGSPLSVIASIRDRVSSEEMIGPKIFFSGPLAERPPLFWGPSNEQLPGVTVPIESEAQVDELVASVAGAGGSHLKVFGKWDRDLFRRLLRLADEHALGVVVDPGMPVFQDIPVDTALALGVTSIEHAQAAWQTVLPQELKATHDSLASTVDMEARSAFMRHVVGLGPDAVDLDELRALGDRWAAAGAFLTPTIKAVEDTRSDPPPLSVPATQEERLRFWGAYADAAVEITRTLAERGVLLLVGHDGMDPSGAVREMELLVEIGIPPEDVLRAATIHAAQWMHEEEELGSLSPDRRADFLLVEKDPLQDMSTLRAPLFVIQHGLVRYRAESFDNATGR
jgi:Amidohydrolase family